MKDEFMVHNQFKESIQRFEQYDPQLKRIAGLPFKYCSPLIHEQAFSIPGVYLIAGGRQVGKTTFIKQFILHLLKEKKNPAEHLFFLAGELIEDHHQLRMHIEEALDGQTNGLSYLFIDEISYIKEWDRAIKYLVDTGVMDHVVVMMTGSDSQIVREAMKRFPGRRGRSAKTDYIFYPLTFAETVVLKKPEMQSLCKEIADNELKKTSQEFQSCYAQLMNFFLEYALHGGYLTAIRDYLLAKEISVSVTKVYADWIRGDILKHNKSERYLHEVLNGIIQTYATQVSFNSLSKRMTIDHHRTVSDYLEILTNTHVIHVLEALSEHKMSAAPKKNKKIYFRDAFIYHAVNRDLHENYDLFKGVQDNAPALMETIVVDHCKRYFETYYIKGDKGEVDVALISGRSIVPIEVKWTTQIRPEESKEIKRFRNGMILSKDSVARKLDKIDILPLIKFLLHIENGKLVVE